LGLPRDVPSAGFSWEAAGLRNDGGRGLRRYGHPPAGGRPRLHLPILRRGSRRSTPPTGRGPRRIRRPTSAGSLGLTTRRDQAGRPDARAHASGSDRAFRSGSSLWVPGGGAAAQAQRRTALYPAKAVVSPCSTRTAPGFPSRLGNLASIGYIQA